MPPDPPDNSDAFDRLDAYLTAMQAGKTPEKDRLLAEHPDLAAEMQCLDALDKLAPPVQGALSEAATIPPFSAVPIVTPPPIPGADFGHYELLHELGRGGMGVVYLARQKGLDRLVALKMILSSYLASEEVIHRFHT